MAPTMGHFVSDVPAHQTASALIPMVHRLGTEAGLTLYGPAVPCMPVVSAPGMEWPAYCGRRDRCQTLPIRRDGSSRVFQEHGLRLSHQRPGAAPLQPGAASYCQRRDQGSVLRALWPAR